MVTLRRGIFGLILLTAPFWLTACSEKNEPPRTGSSLPVTVATASEKTMPVRIPAIGRVEPNSSVSIKAMVSGEVLKVHFREGEDVSKGDVLFTIDPRSYHAELKKAEATLAKTRVEADNARRDADRYGQLVGEGIVTREEYEGYLTKADSLEAEVKADQADVENARVLLSYCTIRSPLSGRTGNLMLHPGNIVKANDDPALVSINQIHPIFVAFSIPERELGDLRKHLGTGPIAIEATIPGEDSTPETGVITFLDNEVDHNTGTIRLKGTFENHDGRLWPGQFVKVVVTLSSLPNVLVVPSQAVQTGQQGAYIFVVKADQTVESRPVTAGISFAGETVIEAGVAPGETVVTDGQMRLYPGARVEIKSAASAGQEAGRS